MTTSRLAAMAAPAGWRPQDEIAAAFPGMAQLARSVLPELRAIELLLDAEEARGLDRSCLRLALRELRWRLEYTADIAGAGRALGRVRRLAGLPSLPAGLATDAEGGCGVCTEIWFLALDEAVDHWLAPVSDAGADPRRRLLDRINHPERLAEYLSGLLVSRPAEDGIDHRKELNFATAGLVRLILRQRPRGYPWDRRLEPVIRAFVAEWQDPATGFFGADYQIGRRRYRTADLSLTFHMARYFDGKISHWPQLIDTLLAMRDGRYPHGWLDDDGMTSHNNYDVAVLMRLGWPSMRSDQRRDCRAELHRLLDWCLGMAIAADGTVLARAAAESLPESYYFAIAFLETLGYFEPSIPFWRDRSFAGAADLRRLLEARLSMLDQGQPMTRMALDRLRGGPAESA